jgi:transaldolase / glucose-6-phosphate isomerase
MALTMKQRIFPGAVRHDYDVHLERGRKALWVQALINKNPSIFKKQDAAARKIIVNRLGWIDIIRRMPPELPRLGNLVEEIRKAGVAHVFILGMGGSSLAPEVFGKTFGRRSWLKSYTVVDTTAPSQLEALIRAVDLTRSFFIVSSKSGTTIETVSQFRFFFRLVKQARPLKAGNFFAAVTDEDSELHRMGRRNRFRKIFLNPADIGGRYSALSFFGLVPAAFTRANLNDIIGGAQEYLHHLESSPDDNEALDLGVLMGCAAARGYDKLSCLASPRMAPFVPWIEQLIAESTGKQRTGIIPIDGESPSAWSAPGADRMFVSLAMAGEKHPLPTSALTGKSPTPRVAITLPDSAALGAEILKWEMATAIAALVLGVNPFDEPNVSESKKNTTAIIQEGRRHRRAAPVTPLCMADDFEIESATNVGGLPPGESLTAADVIKQFLSGAESGDYFALLCYAEMTPEIERLMAALRLAIQEKTGIATLRGFGPRYLHSIGQLYKGGPPKGHFLVIERQYPVDFDIPKLNLPFGRLIKAQAQGDIKAIAKRKRPVVTVNVKADPVAGLGRLLSLIRRR